MNRLSPTMVHLHFGKSHYSALVHKGTYGGTARVYTLAEFEVGIMDHSPKAAIPPVTALLSKVVTPKGDIEGTITKINVSDIVKQGISADCTAVVGNMMQKVRQVANRPVDRVVINICEEQLKTLYKRYTGDSALLNPSPQAMSATVYMYTPGA